MIPKKWALNKSETEKKEFRIVLVRFWKKKFHKDTYYNNWVLY